MMVLAPLSNTTSEDSFLLHLRLIKEKLCENVGGEDVYKLAYHCIETFKHDSAYQNDIRFLKIWLIYMDFSPESHESVFREIQQHKICLDKSLLYESYALFLEANGMMAQAHLVYQSGISRNAEPIGRLKKAHVYFLERMQALLDVSSHPKMDGGSSLEDGSSCMNPWSISIIKNLLQKMNGQISNYDGYHASSKCYSGKVALSTLQKSARNKVIEIVALNYGQIDDSATSVAMIGSGMGFVVERFLSVKAFI